MKVKTYVRVGWDKRRRRQKVMVNARASHAPLLQADGSVMATVAFALVLDVPDKMFEQAEQVIATLTIPEDAATIAAKVDQ